MYALPEHESLVWPRNCTEQVLNAFDWEEFVLGHIHHKDMRSAELGSSAQKERAKRWVLYPSSGRNTSDDEHGHLDGCLGFHYWDTKDGPIENPT